MLQGEREALKNSRMTMSIIVTRPHFSLDLHSLISLLPPPLTHHVSKFKKLGEGVYGTVFLGCLNGIQNVVIKEYKYSIVQSTDFHTELAALTLL